MRVCDACVGGWWWRGRDWIARARMRAFLPVSCARTASLRSGTCKSNDCLSAEVDNTGAFYRSMGCGAMRARVCRRVRVASLHLFIYGWVCVYRPAHDPSHILCCLIVRLFVCSFVCLFDFVFPTLASCVRSRVYNVSWRLLNGADSSKGACANGT